MRFSAPCSTWPLSALVTLSAIATVLASPYDIRFVDYNLNTNPDPSAPVTSFSGAWEGHSYFPSPANWRTLPTYTILLDRWADGDPSRNDYDQTMYEWDLNSNQMRHGGDIQGLLGGNGRTLDYLQSMGIKSIYMAGTPFINMPWQYDQYSALDFSILEPHFGTIDDWRQFVTELHNRGMYLIVDFTVGTLADLVGFEGFLNTSTTFSLDEHKAVWKSTGDYGPINQYPDFSWSNEYNESCILPQFWNEDGTPIEYPTEPANHVGCYNSEFDHYGDTEAFGSHPDWQRELSKFASVQDRLREWKPEVMDKLKVFGCLIINMLDVDGIRIDKATQMTVAALAEWASTTRACGAAVGKSNFFIPGEITGGNDFGSVYLGRGRASTQIPNSNDAFTMNVTDEQFFIREVGAQALDGAAFHYSIYRSLERFLGMDGNLTIGYDVPVNFVSAWNTMVTTNDFLNPSTGEFDPRHLYGVTNQDLFRWPSITNGTSKNALGSFIVSLVLPGIPLILQGEEQEMYIYDSTAANYLYGRQPMTSNLAWKDHGCYGGPDSLGAEQYYQMPFDKSINGCNDPWNGQDHFDPTTPARQVMSRFYYLREQYPALLDGYSLSELGNWTTYAALPGSNESATEWGVHSVLRGPVGQQTLSGTRANVTVLLVYSNLNDSTTITSDCTATEGALFYTGWTAEEPMRNLIYPYEIIAPVNSTSSYYENGLAPYRGCVPTYTAAPRGFAAYVPESEWVAPLPKMTSFFPGHDSRLQTSATEFSIAFRFTDEMDCSSITNGLTISSSVAPESTLLAAIDPSTIACGAWYDLNPSNLTGVAPGVWEWSALVANASDGIYMFSLSNAESATGLSANGTDHLIVRKGGLDNIMIYPNSTTASYSANTNGSMFAYFSREDDGIFRLNHNAAGADMWRYSADFGRTYSGWMNYTHSQYKLNHLNFTQPHDWEGYHIVVQYWSDILGSAAHVVHADANWIVPKDAVDAQRRSAGWIMKGEFNLWGFDAGLPNELQNEFNGSWGIQTMQAWPASLHLHPYADLDDYFLGDVDGDGVLDRMSPVSQAANYVNLTKPGMPYLSYQLFVDESTLKWYAVPRGSATVQLVLFILLALLPPLGAVAAVLAYHRIFYRVTYNETGVEPEKKQLHEYIRPKKVTTYSLDSKGEKIAKPASSTEGVEEIVRSWPEDLSVRRKVLIATMEYEIFGLKPQAKVKIGGLGVMSSLVGKSMVDTDLVWVVPKVGDIEYGTMTKVAPIRVKIFEEYYDVQVENWVSDNITYWVLDSPVFRAQTKADPYPARMDNLESGIMYSTWCQCVAEVIRRTPDITIFWQNDYHSTLAPLYLLPKVIPTCLSLHNAEFQGLWPLRTSSEQKEMSGLFNLPWGIIEKYVQFGSTFNLLHCGAAYISQHQGSTGVAGVSDNYGKRSWARYPALWTLKQIDSLPNPDPSDIAALDETPLQAKSIIADAEAELRRPEDRIAAQRWAGLNEDPEADLFCFVGRWSKQKGVDLIADVFPGILEKHPRTQLITIGPVVDLYGSFAAKKLARLMELYPGRVYSKPEFTALPPFIFSGAEFALIPSRDEPFGLVAVEFGRKGALGVGSRLGGLGLAPGWWFNVESDSTAHMISQFQAALRAALKSTKEQRAVLRARAAVQRFPVLEWRQRTEDFHRRAVLASRKMNKNHQFIWDGSQFANVPTLPEPAYLSPFTPPSSPPSSPLAGRSRASSFSRSPLGFLSRSPSSPKNLGRDISWGSELSTAAGSPSIGLALGGVDQLDYFSNQSRLEESAATTPSLSEAARRFGSSDGLFLASANSRYESALSSSADPFIASPSESAFQTPTQSPRRSRASSFYHPRHSAIPEDEIPPVPAPVSPEALKKSLEGILSEKADSPLNIALASFTDSDGAVASGFVDHMGSLTAANSTSPDYCIELYLMQREKTYFGQMRREKIARARASHRASSTFSLVSSPSTAFNTPAPTTPSSPSRPKPKQLASSPETSFGPISSSDEESGISSSPSVEEAVGSQDELIGAPVAVPTRLQVFLLRSIGGWPLYCIVLALGQMLAASSFQLVLLGGSSVQSNQDLYVIGTVFFFATIFWYGLYSVRPLRWTLSLPFAFYALAFFGISMPSMSPALQPWDIRHAITLTSTCLYAIASAAGFAFFAFNFGEEAGEQAGVWVFRACVVEGSQQVWVCLLWYWGFKVANHATTYVPSKWIMCATMPLCVLVAVLGLVAYMGLPEFYRHKPGHIPNFAATLFRRKLVLWFLASQVLSLYWLSGVYGRNWSFLWQKNPLDAWKSAILAGFFFIAVWFGILSTLARVARKHTWILPIFAVGLGAPRWCQILWGTSSIGLYLPWAGEAGAYLSCALWLWLGVLDAVQGVGLGMMLLQTLSRVHVAATIALAQLLGSVVVIVARATSPSANGPGDVFPNFGLWNPSEGVAASGLASWAFWVAGFCQIAIVIGYVYVFRGEQLSKP